MALATSSIAGESGLLMKLTVYRDALAENVNHVMKAVSPRTTIPILTGIKLEATPEGLTLTGSDSDVSIQAFIPLEEDGVQKIEIHQPGSIVLIARYFADIVKKLPNDQVDIEVDSRFVTRIRSGQAEFSLNGLDAEEYPRLPVIRADNVVPIRKDLLKQVIRQTVYAVSTSETRPVLTGANWAIKNGRLTCVATDSHRLAKRVVAVDVDPAVEYKNVVIPGKSLNELGKILDDNGNDWVDIAITSNQILFKTDNIQFFSRLLEGNYPETDGLIPRDAKTEIILNTKEFLQAIDRASLLAREERNNVVKLKTFEAEKRVEIISQSPEIGRVYESVPVIDHSGEEMRISFSSKYMMDALTRIDAEEIKVTFTGAMKPFLIRPLDDDNILMLILPIRTN